MRNLLIAVTPDDPVRTRAAVAESLRLLAAEPAEVHVVAVQPLVSGHVAMFFDAARLGEIQQEAGRESLQPALSQLDAAGVAYTAHVRVGRSADTIAKVARELGCERIVVGPVHESRSGRGLFGSLAQQLRHLLAGAAGFEVIGS